MSNVPQAYDGKAWAASLTLAAISIGLGYYCLSILELSFLTSLFVLAAVILPLGFIYNWYAKRRGWSQLWTLDILFSILPFDLP